VPVLRVERLYESVWVKPQEARYPASMAAHRSLINGNGRFHNIAIGEAATDINDDQSTVVPNDTGAIGACGLRDAGDSDSDRRSGANG